MATNSLEDIRLVDSTMQGDRRSFEEIVLRYQNLVCSIAFSGTGDLALSEDLAQETFLAAWRNLAQLRDPASLRAWLTGIARRLAANARRALARKPRSVPLADLGDVKNRDPVEQLMRQEEQALVWDTLLQLPENYRDPLVLFYREGQSVRRVAEDLGLSENVVKQRLSRGRQLLTERVAALVAKTLEETKPGQAFVTGVMAALPALAPQAASAAILAAAGKGSATAKAALLGGAAAAIFGPILGMLGGLVSIGASIRSAKSTEERRLMIRVGLLIFVYVGLLNLLLAAAYALSYSVSVGMAWVLMSLSGLLYVGGFAAIGAWATRRQRQVRVETGTDESPDEELTKRSRPIVTRTFTGATLGGVFWIFFMAIGTADWPTAAIVAILAVSIFGISLTTALHRPRWFYGISIAMTLVLAALNLAVVNLRWMRWVAWVLPEGTSDRSLAFPLWALNLLLGGIFAMILASLICRARPSSHGKKRKNRSDRPLLKLHVRRQVGL